MRRIVTGSEIESGLKGSTTFVYYYYYYFLLYQTHESLVELPIFLPIKDDKRLGLLIES